MVIFDWLVESVTKMKLLKTNPFKKAENVGNRLATRRTLFWKLRLISDITFGTALIGIALMIFETELILTGSISRDDPPAFYVKLAISSSTVILLGFLLWYHVVNTELDMNDSLVDSWFLVLTPGRLLYICSEFVVCSIHPPPRGLFVASGDRADHGTIGSSFPAVENDYDESARWYPADFGERRHERKTAAAAGEVDALDTYLSVLMFLRGYLLCRTVVLHSKPCTDASLQSLGAMNRIRFTFSFVFRSMMLVHPFRILVLLIVAVLVAASWTLRACDASHLDFAGSLWLVVITFLTVGYGDLVPRSYCGKAVVVFTGFFGIGCMALVVAVLIQKLEMSATERDVHNFVTTVALQNEYRTGAANIIRWAWLTYRARQSWRRGGGAHALDHGLYYYDHRRLMSALHRFREIRQQKVQLSERNANLLELCNGQRITTVAVAKLECRMGGVEKVARDSLERLEAIQRHLERVETLLHTTG